MMNGFIYMCSEGEFVLNVGNSFEMASVVLQDVIDRAVELGFRIEGDGVEEAPTLTYILQE